MYCWTRGKSTTVLTVLLKIRANTAKSHCFWKMGDKSKQLLLQTVDLKDSQKDSQKDRTKKLNVRLRACTEDVYLGGGVIPPKTSRLHPLSVNISMVWLLWLKFSRSKGPHAYLTGDLVAWRKIK